jgi:hypothetical protein
MTVPSQAHTRLAFVPTAAARASTAAARRAPPGASGASPACTKQHGRPYECAPGGEATLPADYKYISERP